MAKSEAPKRTKRRLRAPTQTVRERAVAAQEVTDKPERPGKIKVARQTTAKPFKASAKFFDRQPFRLIGRVVFPRYFRDAWKELRLVDWPNRKTSRQLTFAVLAFAIVFGASIALVDYGLDKVFKTVLLK